MSRVITDTTSTMPWRGFHHVALVTPDLDATIAFYRNVLGMEAGEVMRPSATGMEARHCFIHPGGDGLGLHFWEHAGARVYTMFGESGAPSGFRFIGGALQHVALALPDEVAGERLLERLRSHGIWTTGIEQLGPDRNLIFADNNGMMVEATWPA